MLNFQRILIIRLDRIGDVLLSTPVIKALRDAYPESHIAMMVRPYSKDIVEGNPYLNEVILYDKDKEYRTAWSTVKFALNLRKKKYDLAIVLHPTNRSNAIPFLAGIPYRIGYNKKLGFLLTHRLNDTKHKGLKHEMEYTLDVIRALGIEPKDSCPYMPLKESSEQKIDAILKAYNIKSDEILTAIHPGASCISKRWPAVNFAILSDWIAQRFGARVVIVGDKSTADISKEIMQEMIYKPVDLVGKITVGELAALLKRCALFVSNDSGPVHVASAVGTWVISIFGRKEPGLGPLRWGPLGLKGKALQKAVDCARCLAHKCDVDFKCLRALTAEEVFKDVERILGLVRKEHTA
ncbi:MAG: lipopolysaccharide heptosyltransferase II [Candidatus Omnitrophica bacterium]|nr:lipopolysaccharide heptosyltransferase II [Candidatus Omnitrophota bacterium]